MSEITESARNLRHSAESESLRSEIRQLQDENAGVNCRIRVLETSLDEATTQIEALEKQVRSRTNAVRRWEKINESLLNALRGEEIESSTRGMPDLNKFLESQAAIESETRAAASFRRELLVAAETIRAEDDTENEPPQPIWIGQVADLKAIL